MTTAHEILQAAQKHMQDRARTYDKPEGERSMEGTISAFKAITGVALTEEQGWLFMAVLKAVRSQQGDYRADSYEDGAAYFALAGEAAGVHAKEPTEAPWIKWEGGSSAPPDVKSSEVVEIRRRDGSASIRYSICLSYWSHSGDIRDIIAYRILK